MNAVQNTRGKRASLTVAGLTALSLAFSGAALAADAAKPAPPTKAAPASGPVYREFVQGKPNAKVTVVEYASLTCPHCAHFDVEYYPALKKDYIDTGKIKYIYRDYPLDARAMGAAVIARCVPNNRGMELIDILFKNQNTWAGAQDPLPPLKMYAQMVGLSADGVEQCLKTQSILDNVSQVAETATSLYHVNATPTFLVGDDQVAGADYDALKAAIDKALAKNTK
jgi:protein-disulfide isomerase